MRPNVVNNKSINLNSHDAGHNSTHGINAASNEAMIETANRHSNECSWDATINNTNTLSSVSHKRATW